MSKSYKKNSYTKSKAVSKSCRCNGSCSYCRDNRLHAVKVAEANAEDTKDE